MLVEQNKNKNKLTWGARVATAVAAAVAFNVVDDPIIDKYMYVSRIDN
jgi:hypothetical protein